MKLSFSLTKASVFDLQIKIIRCTHLGLPKDTMPSSSMSDTPSSISLGGRGRYQVVPRGGWCSESGRLVCYPGPSCFRILISGMYCPQIS